jgi:hypothetical protein
MNTTFVEPYLPRIVMVSKYLIYMAAFESKKEAASLINFADWTSAYAEIILAWAALL